jgi:hypothetical protein
MKTSLLFLLLIVHTQNARIPDANFKQRLLSPGIDLNHDNQTQVSEVSSILI